MNSSFYIDFIDPLPDGLLRIEGYVIGDVNKVIVRTSSGDVLLEPTGALHAHEMPQKEMVQVKVIGADITTATPDRLVVLNDALQPMRIHTNKYTGLGNVGGSYVKKDEVFYRKNQYFITMRNYTKIRAIFYEILFLLRIIGNWRLIPARNALRGRGDTIRRVGKSLLIVIEAIVTIPYALLMRMTVHVYIARKKHPIWLVSDRGMAAGDSGEVFFRYITEQHSDAGHDVYFVIAKQSIDAQRIKQYGKTLDPGSFIYRIKFLLADKIISSHADIEVTNPFLRHIDRYVDLYRFDFVFLQHGIIRNDLSDWLNRYEKNIALFVTSAQREYDSILSYPYYYSPEAVLLSGLPRYDLLESDPQKKLILVPTYRKSLLRLKTDKYGVRRYDNEFKKSEYFAFYNQLITDERLHVVMKAAGMTGEFYLHPNFVAQRQDFTENSMFSIADYPYDYRRAFAEGVLLVSDYSSVVFDFAYLKKPVIYTKFDGDTFFEGHAYAKGDFFSDESDGFGPVTYTYEDLITEIITSIKNHCKMDEKYKKRTDDFFEWHDKQNSERVYQAITQRLGDSV